MKTTIKQIPAAKEITWEFISHADDVSWEREYEASLFRAEDGETYFKIREIGMGSTVVHGEVAIRDLHAAINKAVEEIE